MTSGARIAGLFVYPVKGCAGIELDDAQLTARGLAHDRRWTVVTPAGRFQSQRELPQLATLRPTLTDGKLRLALDDANQIAVPIADVGEPLRVTVWRDSVTALAVDPRVDRTLSEWLGKAVRLVRFPERAVRACEREYAPDGSHTAFADGFPLLVTTQASLADLNMVLEAAGAPPVPMSRFRPNIVLSGTPAGAEDHHRTLAIGEALTLTLVKRCDRCVVTTIDQGSGVRTGKEPLATLKQIRRNTRTGGAWFGQNAVPGLAGKATAKLRVGDFCMLRDDV
jgi:uncharacterized protein